MINVEFMAVSYALVGIVFIGYIGVQHHRVNRLIKIVEEETTSDNENGNDTIE